MSLEAAGDRTNLDPLLCRRALEALRAGVPNRDVVRLLAPLHQRVTTEFQALLRDAESSWETGRPPRGLVVSGGFGSGKSHLLEYLRHVALENNFICSRVVLSKETPLCDLGKVYRACVAAAVAPDKVGPALPEIAETLHTDRAPHYREFYNWAHHDTELDPRLAASLLLFERLAGSDEDLREKILAEWTGFPMKVGEMKAALKAVGEVAAYSIGRPLRGQERRRFEFLTRFFRAAGYNGWVILLDEAELISRYSLRQRGKAYAYLALLTGQIKEARIPGFGAVATITDDYAGEVLRRKGDFGKVPEKMRLAGDSLTDEAERGITLIESGTVGLSAPTKRQVEQTFEEVRALYAAAYGWEPPALAGDVLEYASSTRMRQYVRAWIGLWDLRRLYDYDAVLIAEKVDIPYEEDVDLQAIPPDDSGEAEEA